MNNYKYNLVKMITTRNSLYILLIVIPLVVIDLSTALYIGIVIASLSIIKNITQNMNPKILNGHNILKKPIKSPENVAVFELHHLSSMEILYKYLGVLRMVNMKSKVLIIRFTALSSLKDKEAYILDKVITQLAKRKTIIIFSDVDKNIEMHLIKYDLLQKVGKDKIFETIEDAIENADIIQNKLSFIQKQ